MKRIILCLMAVLGSLTLSIDAQTPDEAASATVSVTGSILNSGGQPLSATWVTIMSGQAVIGQSLSGDDGKFNFENILPGAYSMSVSEDKERRFKVVPERMIEVQTESLYINLMTKPQ